MNVVSDKQLHHATTFTSSFNPPMYKTTSRLLSHAYHAFPISHLAPRRLFSVASAAASSGVVGSKFGSFMEFVREVVKRGPSGYDSVAIRAEKKSYTYAQIMSSAWNVSKLLCDFDLFKENERNGVLDSVLGKENGGRWCLNGARIGILAKPSAEFVAGMLGIWLGGGVAVPLALSYPEAELLHVMNDSEVSVLLSNEEHQEIMKNIAAKCSAQFSLIPDVSSNMLKTNLHDLSTVQEQFSSEIKSEGGADSIRNEGDRPALIVYTSGTTGKPKGVVHTHKSITSQVQILTEAWGYSSSDGFLHCLPLHHVHGLFNVLLAPLYAGSTVEFMPKFSVRGVWQRWRESYPEDGSSTTDAITVFSGVPTMYTWLIQGYELMDSELQSTSSTAAHKLRLMMCGSSALPLPIMKQWESITGHCLLERYGMTEFVMALANPLQGERKGGTVGKPLPLVEAKILQEEENCKDINKVGELCIKSPSLFKEYWKRPEVTRESFTDCGFFKTGDTVKMDEDGYYIILGRTSADIMKVGGYKLSALEIESVLLEHPAISECAVLGLPDKDYGEAVCAIIVPQASSVNGAEQDQQSVSSKEFNAGAEPKSLLALSLDELRTWSKDKLAPYKIPAKLFVWDKLPRNAMGKVNKKELKKLLP